MFENKTEAQAREEILAMVAEYADRFPGRPDPLCVQSLR